MIVIPSSKMGWQEVGAFAGTAFPLDHWTNFRGRPTVAPEQGYRCVLGGLTSPLQTHGRSGRAGWVLPWGGVVDSEDVHRLISLMLTLETPSRQ